jgi:hypothetical protein
LTEIRCWFAPIFASLREGRAGRTIHHGFETRLACLPREGVRVDVPMEGGRLEEGSCMDAMVDPIPAQPFLTGAEHLATFGPRCELVDTRALAAAARRMIGGAVDYSFPRFVEWLRSEGYVFGSFEDGPLRYDERIAYLRYDVHPQDLLAAYVLADLHERLGIVGSFQITWKFSRNHEPAEPYFLKLLEFDRRFIQFGLHAAPVATWYLNAKLGGNADAIRSVESDEFAAWVLELHTAYLRDGDDALALREIRQGADDTFSQLAASFREAFGEWRSVSGHGNFLTGAFTKVRARHPKVRALQAYFFPGDYLHKWGVTRFGFDHQAAGVGTDAVPFPRMMWEGAPTAERRRCYRGRVSNGAGFVALLHPASWTCTHNATFFLPDEPVPPTVAQPPATPAGAGRA